MNRAFLFLAAASLFAQAPQPSFDVVAIHPSAPNTQRGVRAADSGRFSATAFTLNTLIRVGWSVREFQIAGGPSWVDSLAFDIEARGNPSATYDDLGKMIQSLLADRFQLKFHRDTRQLPVYALVVAKTGSRLHPSDPATQPDITGGPGNFSAHKTSVENLALVLSRQMDHPVLDRTGLSGLYDFKLEWSPDGSDSAAAPSIFTAVQEQLGLKLETQSGPIEVLVIDHAEKPSEN